MTVQHYKLTYPPEAGVDDQVHFQADQLRVSLRKGETKHARLSDDMVAAATAKGVVAEPVEVQRYTVTNTAGGSAIPFETVNGMKQGWSTQRALLTPDQVALAEASGLEVIATPRPAPNDPLSLLEARVAALEAAAQ